MREILVMTTGDHYLLSKNCCDAVGQAGNVNQPPPKSPKPLNIIPFSKIFDTVIFIHNAVFQNLLAFGAYILELSFGLK